VSEMEDYSRLFPAFDAIYEKEVIEHIVPWREHVDALRRTLRPGGRLWISTPNYGEPWLDLLERTALGLVARRSGFTRRDLHPTRFSRRSLAQGLSAAGFEGVESRVVAFRLALAARGRRPEA